MTQEQAHQFATQWAEEWNRRDVEAVLAHFAEDCEFVSPKAQQFVGRGALQGKTELRHYWQTALQQIHDLHFVLDSVFLGPEERQIIILYAARLNGKTHRAAEVLHFDDAGRVRRGEALYGVSTE